MKTALGFVVGAILVLASFGNVSAANYAYTPVDYPGASSPLGTTVTGINNLGTIVGYYRDANGDLYRGFSLNNGTYVSFSNPGSLGTVPGGINDAGTIVGYYYGAGFSMNGFSLSGTTYTPISYPEPCGINDAGTIVGDYSNGAYHGFVLSGGTYASLDYPGASNTLPRGINNIGTIVGEYADASGTYRGFSLSNGIYTTLNYPGSLMTEATGINNTGDVVGLYEDASGMYYGFSLSNGIYTTLNYPGSLGTYALGINDAGNVVGLYYDGNTLHGFVATPIPIPITVDIDIRPWSKRNPINYKGHGIIPVAILSTKDFDAPSQVDQNTLTFGAAGNEASLAFCNPRPRDVNRDGSKDDLVCHFYIETAGFKCGDAEGFLKGKTLSGTPFEGKDLVRIINCK